MVSTAKRLGVVVVLVFVAAVPAVFLLTAEGCACERPSALVKSALSQLIGVQESYFADHGTYSPSLDALQLGAPDTAALQTAPDSTGPMSPESAPVQPVPGVLVAILEANSLGWSARASYVQRVGECAVFIGRVSPPLSAMREGELRCTRFRGRLLGRW